MKLYAPSYYEEFKCAAEACTHSCCVGWEIGADRETLAWHAGSQYTLSRELLSSLYDGGDGTKYIELCEGGKCPFLDASGLCRIISELGEERAPRICREHPRFYHRIGERFEVGVGASCEAAARLILSRDVYEMVEVERNIDCGVEGTEYDALSEREKIYSIIRGEKTLDSAIEALMREYEIPAEALCSKAVLSTLNELEFLSDDNRSLFKKIDKKCPKCKEKYAKRLFLYLIFRHVSIAQSRDDVRVSLAFCILLCAVFYSADATDELDCAARTARIISEEIEYSSENTDALKLELFSLI